GPGERSASVVPAVAPLPLVAVAIGPDVGAAPVQVSIEEFALVAIAVELDQHAAAACPAVVHLAFVAAAGFRLAGDNVLPGHAAGSLVAAVAAAAAPGHDLPRLGFRVPHRAIALCGANPLRRGGRMPAREPVDQLARNLAILRDLPV